MATKKKDDAEESAEEAAGIVPKGDSVDDVVDEVADDATDADAALVDAEAGVTVDVDYEVDEAPDPNAPPPPVTPSSSAAEQQGRVLYEDQINADARAFASRAEAAYIEAALAGRGIAIVVDDDDALTT